MNAVDAVQAADFACHRALDGPKDDMSRGMLLETLASFKATPLASLPARASSPKKESDGIELNRWRGIGLCELA